MRDQPAPVGATWFSNLSDFQVEAIDALAFSIRDDQAEATVYRTQFCLSRLGVTPMVKARMLRKLLSVCRGSDLALLYFLLEACYKGAGFAYSEKILMAAITYLDLEMTMRELDRILPPGVERLKRVKKSIVPPVVTTSISLRPSSPQRVSDLRKVRSPYFTPLPKPKVPQSGGKFSSKPAGLVVTFPFWPAGERPNYRVNEANRWFADYKFQPVKRMLFRMVGDIMSDYWAKVGEADEDVAMPMCEFHKEALRQEQLVKDAAMVKAHKQCLALIDLNTRHDVALKKRIVAQLDKDIEDCTLRWKRLRERHHTDVMLLEDHDQMCAMGKVPTTVQPDRVKHLFHKADIGRLNAAPNMQVHVVTGKASVSRLSTVRISDPEDDVPCPVEVREEKLAKCPPPLLGHMKRPRRVMMTQTRVGDERPSSCRKHQRPGRFFRSPSRRGPFVFHYHELAPRPESHAPRDVMRAEAIRSLRPQSCPSSEDQFNERLDPRAQVVAAIVECAQNMWFGSLEAHQRNKASFESKKSDPPLETCGQGQGDLDWTRDITHFDPDNHQLMERLLKDGFSILRRDPRCVFAAFPDSHKSTVMKEWIKRRYGKTYSYEEIGRGMRKGLKTFVRVVHKLANEPPSAKRTGYSAKDTYDDIVRLKALSERLKANYRMPLNDKILNLTSICWQALQPHLVNGSSLLNSFFAYLPVRYADMLR
ncbi:uncharacterized protein LOC128266427 [Drosophila gunungcola]|uniref:uncharacterized protein LOC128266427 n=1 Tax=Drosophila gunungcola TaxID=103775 RepID=UPI0022E5AEC7|nr:uncharacterized protein LOC128266427 [Drosophila gunungcola]